MRNNRDNNFYIFSTDLEEYQRQREQAAKVRAGKVAKQRQSFDSVKRGLQGMNDNLMG